MPSLLVYLLVADLGRSITFYSQLGFGFDPGFTDDGGTPMQVGDAVVMLLTPERFKNYTSHQRTSTTDGAILGLPLPTAAEVDAFVEKAVALGGTSAYPPRDSGWVYCSGFADPDGHLWELFAIDRESGDMPYTPTA